MFVQVDMLYVSMEVNGHQIKAFIDSGAQVTLTPTTCARELEVLGQDPP